MKLLLTSILFTGLIAASCDSKPDLSKNGNNDHIISLLGDTLEINHQPLPDSLRNRIESMSQAALEDSLIVDHLIWEARLSAYEGKYFTAIAQFTEAIQQFPNEPRLYRHRGHRYITIRRFDLAKKDLRKAAELFEGVRDISEPDGLPNARNVPLSSLQTNTWYHLGLAHYLSGEYDEAIDSYTNGLKVTTNEDMRVAFLYWIYMSFRKSGKDADAGLLVKNINPDLKLIENDSYHKLILVFNGTFKADDLITGEENELENSTLGYGLGFWHDINGRNEMAEDIWQGVYENGNPASFGFIASEAELVS